MKQRGFAQGIFQQSSTKKEELGTLRIGSNGKAYRYARAGATALAAGVWVKGVAIAAAHENQAILAAVAVGTKSLTVTVTAGTAIAENELQGGELAINDATGKGHTYEIESNTAITTAETDVTLALKRGIKVALDVTSEFTLIRNPFYGGIVSTTQTLPDIGGTPIAVTALNYFWAQRGGLGICLIGGTATAGQPLMPSDGTAGGLENADAVTEQSVAIACFATTDTEYGPVRFTLG